MGSVLVWCEGWNPDPIWNNRNTRARGDASGIKGVLTLEVEVRK